MTNAARRNIALLRASHERLGALVEPLTGDQLRSPAYPAEWSIGQVLSHLGSQSEIMGLYLDAALAGTDPPGSDAFPTVWDAWNQLSPEEHRRRGQAATEQLVERLEALTDHQVATLAFVLFGGIFETDVAGFARLRLAEHAMHTWDVAVALDPAAVVAPDAVDVLTDAVIELAGRLGRPQGVAFVLQVDTEAPARSLALSVGEAVSFAPWTGQDADGALRLPAEALLRLVYGRLDPDHTPALELDSELVTLDDLRAVFPGF